MRAFRIRPQGGPEPLEAVEVPAPEPGPEEVRVVVRATALNRADLLQTMGLYPAPPGVPADIPGLELCGEVEAVGARVTELRPGDPVMGLVGGGAFSQRVVLHEREAIPIAQLLPRMDLVRAAALPEAFATAYDALVLQGHLTAGETVLLHAAASGVGTAASQLARALGARSIGTSRSAHKLEVCRREHGLDEAITVDGASPRFAAQVRALTSGRGADVALELVGGAYLSETIEALARRGRVLLVGVMGGASPTVELRGLMSRRASLTGTVLRSRPLEEKIAVAQAVRARLVPLFASGALRPVIDRVLPIDQVNQALQALRANETIGKIVLTW